ncbi:MAG: hypothetical protein IKT13_00470, partial [Paludibacteraceae bacterium]|nr:hypothetical protein [Paludibacteraceae bacterium]
MRKLIAIVLLALSLPMMAGIHSYKENSVLNSGKWVKIRVSESGVCRMSFDQLRNAGLNPSQLRVFGYGGAMLTQDFKKRKIDDLPQVPVYIGSDYVLFWVQGPISWSFNGSNFTHTRNPYSNYGYYFLTDNVGSLLVPTAGEPISGPTPTDVTTYSYYQLHEKDSVNLVDRTGIVGGGRDFYGEQFAANQRRTFSFTTPNAVAGAQTRARIAVAGYSSVATAFNSSFNGTAASTNIKPVGDFYTFACVGTISSTATAASGKQQVQLTYQASNASALGWLDYIELTTISSLRMTGSYMPVRTKENYQTDTPVRFLLSGANSSIQVWDITRLDSIVRMPTTLNGSELEWIGWQDDGVHEYVAVNTAGSQWVSAQVMGSIANQNLHRLKNIDYVIICPAGYESIASDLAKAHQAKEGITWAVVTDQQVYNEFS